MQFTFNLHQSWCFSALTTMLHLLNYVPFLPGLRTPLEREERLRHIPTAYNYRLQPPLKNITTQREAEEPGLYLGFIIWGRRPDWPKATSLLEGSAPPHPPPPDEIWCILRHNFEKCYSVCTNLVASWWFFGYSHLYTVMITIFLGGVEAGHSGGEASTLQIPW